MGADAECIFCRIVRGDIPSSKVFEDDLVVAFHDIEPVAPTHVLIVPREHIASVSSLGESDRNIAGALLVAARRVAEIEGVMARGFRVVGNSGEWGGQTVDHLHLHLIGGRPLGSLG